MKISKYLFFILLVFVGMLSFQSCDEESYDVVGNPDNLIYVKTNYNFDVLRSPMGGVEAVRGDEIMIKIPVYATRPVDSEVTVSADFDVSLVEQYNAVNSVEYKSLDENLIVWTKKSVKFLPGAYVATDSIEFSIPKEECVHLLNESYVIPIRLTDASNYTISLNNGCSYTIVNCDYIYLDPDADKMSGTMLTDKSDWEISSDDSSADLLKCIDGDLNSVANFKKIQMPTITVDLKSVKNIHGATIHTPKGYLGELRNLSWSVSSDGKNWTDICSLNTPINTPDGYRMVLLGYLEARYVKFCMKWTYVSYGADALSEINIYVDE